MCLRQHMLLWFPDFSERAMQLARTRFYRGVLRMTAGWFAFDSETIDSLNEAIRQRGSKRHVFALPFEYWIALALRRFLGRRRADRARCLLSRMTRFG